MKASSSAAPTQVPVGLLGLATNTTRVRSLMARAMAARSWPSGMGESAGSAGTATPVAPVAWTAMGYTAKAYCEYTASRPGCEEGFGQQHQRVVGAVAERDLAGVDAELGRQLVLEHVTAAVGIQPGIGERALHGLDRQRARPERVLVRRQLDDVADAELALQLFDGFARHIRRQRAHVFDGEQAGSELEDMIQILENRAGD